MQRPLPPRRRNTPLLVALGAALLAVAVLVTVLLVNRSTTVDGTALAASSEHTTEDPVSSGRGEPPGGAYAQVGDCVKFESPRLRHTLATQVDCAAPDAVYQVGYRDDSRTTGTCPTQSYDQYTQTGPDGNFMLCLMMNGRKGTVSLVTPGTKSSSKWTVRGVKWLSPNGSTDGWTHRCARQVPAGG